MCQKSRGPLEKSQETADYLFCLHKKKLTNFQNQRYIFNRFFIILAMFLEHDPGENAPQLVLTLYLVYAE
jgi:hypothetical protein